MEDRYSMLKIEEVVNKLLYSHDVISKRKYERMVKRLDKLLFEERKKNSSSTLT